MSGTLKPDDIGPAGPVMGGFRPGGGVVSPARAYRADAISDIRATLGEHAASVRVALQDAHGTADKPMRRSRAAWLSGAGSLVAAVTAILSPLLPLVGVTGSGVTLTCLAVSAVLIGAGVYFGRVQGRAAGEASTQALAWLVGAYDALQEIWPVLDATANAVGKDLPDRLPPMPADSPENEEK